MSAKCFAPARLLVGVLAMMLVTGLATGCVTDFFSGPNGTAVGGNAPPVFPLVDVSPAGTTVTALGGSVTFSGSYFDSSGAQVSGLRMSWTSLNPAIATVNSSNGRVTAVASGQGSIAGVTDSVTGYALLTVAVAQDSPFVVWTKVTSPGPDELRGVWGVNGNDVYAVGKAGTLLHQGGSGWTDIPSGVKENLNAVWGTATNAVYAVGDGGRLL